MNVNYLKGDHWPSRYSQYPHKILRLSGEYSPSVIDYPLLWDFVTSAWNSKLTLAVFYRSKEVPLRVVASGNPRMVSKSFKLIMNEAHRIQQLDIKFMSEVADILLRFPSPLPLPALETLYVTRLSEYRLASVSTIAESVDPGELQDHVFPFQPTPHLVTLHVGRAELEDVQNLLQPSLRHVTLFLEIGGWNFDWEDEGVAYHSSSRIPMTPQAPRPPSLSLEEEQDTASILPKTDRQHVISKTYIIASEIPLPRARVRVV